MPTEVRPTLIAHRYQLLEPLGEGGMGVVYRAIDRLTERPIALKRLAVGEATNPHDTTPETEDMRLALSREFRLMAALRHPGIVSVLDYGFDGTQPFFTMDLLPDAQPIDAAMADKPLTFKLDALAQMFRALAYLHRRGIVHRDLKPGNVLVTPDGVVKLLDFGLSQEARPVSPGGQSTIDDGRVLIGGTVFYMAPELLKGGEATQSSDLYAAGTIACEVLQGRLPFVARQPVRLFHMMMSLPPDIGDIDAPLQPVIARMLAKTPDQRYPDAESALEALYAAIGVALPPESAAVREHLLQAWQFVGRDAEMNQLRFGLRAALNGTASAWLIGGAQGVGKSRLLDELRIRALVRGALVRRGSCTAQDGSPKQLWGETLRHLALMLDPTQASLVKEFVPGLDALLGVEVADLPPMSDDERFERILAMTHTLFNPQRQTLVLLLEDLHWADDDSLAILRTLLSLDRPWLIVGAYRDDLRPTLPDELAGMRVITLANFDEKLTAVLAAALLGTEDLPGELTGWLFQQTAGNPALLVEVVRVLVEEAGGVDDIRRGVVPEHVANEDAGRLMLRRLAQLSADERGLLALAAVAGRQLDLTLLGALYPGKLDPWLTTCANAAILEQVERRWQFAHDALRKALIAALSEDRRKALERRVAEGRGVGLHL